MAQALKAPKQERSKLTLHRMMEAAEKLMSEKPFEKITLQQLVSEAGTTTGSFYARFPDKYAMLAALFDEHVRSINEIVEKSLSELDALDPKEQVAWIVSFVAETFSMRPALMRSGTLLFWNHPMGSDKFDLPMCPTADVIYDVERHLVMIAEAFGSDDPRVHGRHALKIILATSRHHFLFADDRTILKTTDREFTKQLTRMIIAYLKSEE